MEIALYAYYVSMYCLSYITTLLTCIHNVVYLTEEKDAAYGNRYQEAVKIFNSLLSLESLADPIKEVLNILQKCMDIEDLQSEVQYSIL